MTARSQYGRPFSTGSRQLAVCWLRTFFLYLAERGLVILDPTRLLRTPRRARRLPRHVLTPAEMDRLLALPDVRTALGLRDRALLEVLYGTGLRFSELADLAVGDVDLDERTLWVRHGKGKKDRVLPLGRWAAHWLSRHLERSAKDRGRSAGDRVFFTWRGNRLDNTELNRQLREDAHRAGIDKPLTLHLMRHTFATVLIKGGADVRYVQRLLGHADLSTTAVYTHLDLGDLRRVQERCHPRERVRRIRRRR
jgi:integrase/recombinase XerD